MTPMPVTTAKKVTVTTEPCAGMAATSAMQVTVQMSQVIQYQFFIVQTLQSLDFSLTLTARHLTVRAVALQRLQGLPFQPVATHWLRFL